MLCAVWCSILIKTCKMLFIKACSIPPPCEVFNVGGLEVAARSSQKTQPYTILIRAGDEKEYTPTTNNTTVQNGGLDVVTGVVHPFLMQ